ncbi:MAG: BatA and WFA domain-containing protein [Phycisphaerales bacterium]|nr:BatA and WFA domain-containing protein [Phycisphaerales bacterium]
MTFLTWPIALVAAACTIPPLVLLYFLKLRRRPVQVASTFLWSKSVKDIEVNAPFRMLRFSWLLVLQLLLMTLLYLALARPVLNLVGVPADRTIIVIDTSASMRATDGSDGRSRLDHAKELAGDLVRRTVSRAAGREAMIVTYAASAHRLTDFTSSQGALTATIQTIEPTDQPADFADVLRLVHAYVQPDEEEQASTTQVVLISDGDIASASGEPVPIRIPSGAFRFIRVGPAGSRTDNVGIVAMNAKRDYNDPATVRFFARIVNASAESVEAIAVWHVDDRPIHSQVLTIPGTSQGETGEASVTHAIDNTQGALVVLRVRASADDVLPVDDAFAIVLPPAGKPRVLLVSPDGRAYPRIGAAIESAQPEAVDEMNARRFDALADADAARYDLIVFDRVTPTRLPATATISFGASLPIEGLTLTPVQAGRSGGRFLSWRRTHALMRYIGLDQIRVGESGILHLPADGIELARGAAGTWIGLIERDDGRHLLVAFEVAQSSWERHLSFPIFMMSAVEYLTFAGDAGVAGYVTTARSASVPVEVGTAGVTLQGPVTVRVDVQPGRSRALLPVLPVAGVYAVQGAAPDAPDHLAVNLADERETLAQRRDTIRAGGDVIGSTGVAQAAPREIWRWLVMAAVVVVIVEWLVYIRRARV